MKLKVEVSPTDKEEIIIRCNNRDERVKRIENAIENLINENAELVLYLNESEFYVQKKKILFFECVNGKTLAHTKDNVYYAKLSLSALEDCLPNYFLRASKSCIINAFAVSFISHNVAGPSKVGFTSSQKTTFASRAYFKYIKERIYQLRGLK